MSWGRLDDKANGNAKLQALGNAAWRMWGCALIFCQDNLTDGFIPEFAIDGFCVRFTAKEKRADVVNELCSKLVPGKDSLWHRVEGGYQVHDYLDWNDSREKILKDRELAESRKNRFKSGRRNASQNAFQNAFPDIEQNASQNASGTPVHVPQPHSDPAEERRIAGKPHPIKQLLDLFSKRYEQIIGAKPHIDGSKDTGMLQSLLKQHDESTIRSAMEAYFDQADQYVKDRGYALGVFRSQFNAWLAKSVPKAPTGDWYGHYPHCRNSQECAARMLREKRESEAAAS